MGKWGSEGMGRFFQAHMGQLSKCNSFSHNILTFVNLQMTIVVTKKRFY